MDSCEKGSKLGTRLFDGKELLERVSLSRMFAVQQAEDAGNIQEVDAVTGCS